MTGMERALIGDRIKQHREKRGMTRRELALKTGVTEMSVYLWEREDVDKRRFPDRLRLPIIARALKTTVGELTKPRDP